MTGRTIPLDGSDEAAVFSPGSRLVAQNGFTGYWHGGDLGAFSEPFQGIDTDFIEVSVVPGYESTFTILSDLLLISNYPYDPSGEFIIPEVQILEVTVWAEVRMSDGSIGFIEVTRSEVIPDAIFDQYPNGDLDYTSVRVTFTPEPPHHVDFVGSGTVYRVENGEVVTVSFPLIYDGYDTTGRYFLEINTLETDPLYTGVMAGTDIYPNGRYMVVEGSESNETLSNGFRTEAWGESWLQTIPFGVPQPVPAESETIDHLLATGDNVTLLAVGENGDPDGASASVRVYSPAGSATVGGNISVDATAIGGDGTATGGAASVRFDAIAYSGTDLVLRGRAEGGDGATPGTAQASMLSAYISLGQVSPSSRLVVELSALGGQSSGGSRAASTVTFQDNSIGGWAGNDTVTITLGRSGEESGIVYSSNSLIMGGGNDRMSLVVNGSGALTFNSINQFQGGDGFDILTLDFENGIAFSLGASISAHTAFVTGVEVLRGGRGSDELSGDGAANYLQGEAGNDTLQGALGNDVLDGGAGNDMLDGGIGGFDTVTFEQLELGSDGVTVTSRATAGVIANLGTGIATGAGTDTLSNFENVRGTQFDDRLTGDSQANVLTGLGGNDVLDGGWGDDVLVGGLGDDVLIGGNGWDTADYSRHVPANLFDPVSNPTGPVHIDLRILVAQDTGGAGSDLLSGVENLIGTSGNDILIGDALANYFEGGSGHDVLHGNGSSDTLVGGAGNDILDGGTAADIMRGGTGDDTYYVNSISDQVRENADAGIDTVYSSASFSLRSNVENLILTGSAIRGNGNNLVNQITGTDGNNVINGGLSGDMMAGGLGNDLYYVDNVGDNVVEASGAGRDRVYTTINWTLGDNIEDVFARGSGPLNLTGNALDNVLRGNSGNNVLDGRGGSDDLKGGAGADTFVFRDGEFGGLTPSTADRIIDFTRSDGDIIDLSTVDANSLSGGDQAFAFIGAGAFTNVAGQLRYEQVNGNTYVYGDTNGDGVADFMIRVDGTHSLVLGDFVI